MTWAADGNRYLIIKQSRLKYESKMNDYLFN
ncbi:Uncharacterised protein [Yersinia pekkanenii]|uniref:Uncharacterized protein n=1 Tax=Yersinia pekkanenii TaxID=1288385 RepID=A0A0T9PQZ0_9GAMM|nr:Uncharacterised protein [Yersinia pekkanenii]CRY68580.1 Uncharacterised protein [Yersinia pekkanenii]